MFVLELTSDIAPDRAHIGPVNVIIRGNAGLRLGDKEIVFIFVLAGENGQNDPALITLEMRKLISQFHRIQ